MTCGLPTVFVRLTGCPLRCVYCDSEYAFHGGEKWTLENILLKVASFAPRHVCVTGGEPLAQPNVLALLKRFCDKGYQVSLETSGAMDVSAVDRRVSRVMDLKTPSSGEASKNLYENVAVLTPKDQVKFVLGGRDDYEWAKFKLDELELVGRVGEILFSPIYEQLDASVLADWIVTDNLPVRFQVQLHKILWGDKPGV